MRLEDKLRNLDRFGSAKVGEKTLPEEHDQAAELFSGAVTENRFGKFVLLEKSFGLDYRHGKTGLASCSEHKSKVLGRLCFSKSSAPKNSFSSSTFDLKRTAFIDCETTGLAGGVGTYAFLVGMGYFGNDQFNN